MKGEFGQSIDLDWIPRYILVDADGNIALKKAIVADDAEWVNDRSHNSGSNDSSGTTSRGAHTIPNNWVVYNESDEILYN